MATIFLIVEHSFAMDQNIAASNFGEWFGVSKLVAWTYDPFGLARRWKPISLLLNTALPWVILLQPPCLGDYEYEKYIKYIVGLTNLLSEHSSDLAELGDGSHFPYCFWTQLYHDRSNYCSQQICGILKLKINIPVFMVLFWGVRPEGEITSLPFLMEMWYVVFSRLLSLFRGFVESAKFGASEYCFRFSRTLFTAIADLGERVFHFHAVLWWGYSYPIHICVSVCHLIFLQF